jgi:hypothetical protein
LDRDVQNSTAAESSWALEISKDPQGSVQEQVAEQQGSIGRERTRNR